MIEIEYVLMKLEQPHDEKLDYFAMCKVLARGLKAQQAAQEPTGGAIEGEDVPWPFPPTKGSPVTDPEGLL